ncbi:two-component system sensor histidine kinase YcbA [Anaerosolibacter carboniphilus]|uniref:histidine kinase n=1 Tax=Anaerosolibacter carboniphilus TaxID=1417629 RepID=A0A841KQA1_9FIRM|nr:sensor histidine kinase [Anaerosolibacter carboniphilus]MBB6215934.1 two-component system sensor histidine kinase YcbA [Anaerosolibacter carboniphilus]
MEKAKKYFLFMITIALFGEIYFYPFNSSLRISAGIIALNLIILVIDDISEFSIALLATIGVFVLRNITGIYFSTLSLPQLISYNLPSAIYYLVYGFLAFFLGVRKYREQLLTTVFLMASVDSLSNIAEALIRDKLINFHMLQVIVLVGLARSIIAYFIYLLYKNQELFILNREHQKRYGQLNILIADIQAEMFYLRKSMDDIETVMSKSYRLYEKYKEHADLQEDTLDIAREVHEIKKDYHRVLGGFESFLKNFEDSGSMTLQDMQNIIKENIHRYLSTYQKDITIQFDFIDDFRLIKYYNLFTVMNNLIINAIDASGSNGVIQVTEYSNNNHIFFSVTDHGEGIEEDVLPYIFNPGFTTKYDVHTGKPSTGIGLSHVKNIIETLHGSISVTSELEKGTSFILSIPKQSLIG